MSRKTPVPITPSVLAWAIDESGLDRRSLAKRVGVTPAELERWELGTEQPGVTQARALAKSVQRSLTVLMLPSPPPHAGPNVAFRPGPGEDERSLNPAERKGLRQAARLQRMLGWISEELGKEPPRIPRGSPRSDPERMGAAVRRFIGVSTSKQAEWSSASEALRAWRTAFEQRGIAVFGLSMGSESCRGFSLPHGRAPVVAYNTHWNTPARIFTLFHELGHLVTDTPAACSRRFRKAPRAWDPVERWCERFAASALLPWGDIVGALGLKRIQSVDDLSIPQAIARQFKVSLRAATILLIERGLAEWDLYDSIPPVVDDKKPGGAGGRSRAEIRADQLGSRTAGLFAEAWRREVISRTTILDYLDVPDSAVDDILAAAPAD